MTSQDTEALKALVALAHKATAGEWVVHQRKTPFHSAAIPEYEIPEHRGEHIENIVTTDWVHPQLKDVLVINNIGYGLPKEPGEPRADLISMSEDDAAFIAAARNAIPALERMLASQMGQPQHAYFENGRVTIVGIPDADHNCDAMGCSTVEHVLIRLPVTFPKPEHQGKQADDK